MQSTTDPTVQTIIESIATHSDVYTPSDRFNGMTAMFRKQILVVVGGGIVHHSRLFPNKKVVGRVALVGKRGAVFEGYVSDDGRVMVNAA